MKQSKIYLGIIFIFLLATFSCTDDKELTIRPDTLNESTAASQFAAILANALQDQDVRVFLRNESLKKFDQDYDILVNKIKDEDVRPGESFFEILSKHNSSSLDLNTLFNAMPLLTIFIPELPNFSASNWDIVNSIPLVANAYSIKNEKEISVVDYAGKFSEFMLDETPSFPVVVLKDCERVRAVSKEIKDKNDLARHPGNQIFYESDKFRYYLTQDSDLGLSNARVGISSGTGIPPGVYGFHSKVKTAYTKSLNCNNCFHRDYIYYNISPTDGVLEGTFDNTFTEAITSIQISNTALNAISNNWTEGELELHFNIFFIGAESVLDRLEKVIFVSKSEILTYGYKMNNNTTVLYNFPTPIKIVPWKMNVYGDRWKVAAYEYDPSTMVSYVVNHSSTVGTNFKADAGGNIGLVKVGVGLGISTTSVKSSTTTVQQTLSSNILGEGILNWSDPVITKNIATFYWSNDVNTGGIRISIETIPAF